MPFNLQRYVVVKVQVEGMHRWEACPFEEVKFLRNPHRHIFHITCKKAVEHNDRDIEIILLKRAVQNYLTTTRFDSGIGCLNFGNSSCEDIAEVLINEFNLTACQVLEDGENGAESFNLNNK